MSEEWVAYKKKVAAVRAKVFRVHKELADVLLECTHQETVPKSHYFEGSYLDTDYTDYWDECVACGKRLNPTHVGHGNYG